jgi:DNA repair protein RadA/Sms
MSKPKTVFVCGECGYESSKWMGKCPACESWNTMIEEKTVTVKRESSSHAVPLRLVTDTGAERTSTGIGELDRVLGGGIVAGSAVLLGGDPGIGKSTLLMQAAAALCQKGKVLYVTGEESAAQLKMRAKRLDAGDEMLILAETDLSTVEDECVRLKPQFIIIDSIQTMYSPELSSAAGSVSQVREATQVLTRFAKSTGSAIFIVGHVTKDGSIAGPRVLEHMVDTVLYFEGDRHDAFRLLRAVKNRFGSTNEIGVFEMRDTGMIGVQDPSLLFLSGKRSAGCAVTCVMEGTRPVPAEVQALINNTVFGNPRRMATGLDQNRLVLLLAVLEKKAGLRLSDKDVYANVVGGLKLEDRAGDLAIALSIASCLLDAALPEKFAAIGEISLTGEVLSVSRLEKRIQECVRLGFRDIMIPKTDNVPEVKGTRLIAISDINDAALLLMKKEKA